MRTLHFVRNEKNTFMEFVNWYRMAIFWKVQYDRKKNLNETLESINNLMIKIETNTVIKPCIHSKLLNFIDGDAIAHLTHRHQTCVNKIDIYAWFQAFYLYITLEWSLIFHLTFLLNDTKQKKPKQSNNKQTKKNNKLFYLFRGFSAVCFLVVSLLHVVFIDPWLSS